LRKNPLVAITLSFLIAGAGQVYNGEFAKGLVLLLGALAFWLLLDLSHGFSGLLAGLIWIFSMYDAYMTARDKNPQWNK